MASPVDLGSSMAAEDSNGRGQFSYGSYAHAELDDLQLGQMTEGVAEQHYEAFPQGICEVTIDSETSQCVNTLDLEDAEELLKETGQVVLCGPPGCGKSTLALALLRRSKDQGFTPHIITTLKELNSADIKRSVTSGHTVLLFDGTLGEVRVDRRQHDLWTAKRPGLMELVDQGRCRLIITLYPHVLREVRQLERGAHSPLSDRSLAMQVESTLEPEVKEQMLVFHLEERQMSEAEHRKVVQTVLQTDRSGPGFPWCCHRLAQHWSSYKDLALFSAPEETQALLFDEMVTHPIHGRPFAAVLALTMRGVHGFLHRPGQAQPELTRLGFEAFSDDQLAEYADVLRGSVLTEDGKNYASRVLYDAAALALGRSFRLPTMLRACDVKFLVQHVCTTQIKPKLHVLEKQFAANVSDMEDAQVRDATDAQISETADAQVPDTTHAQIPETTDAPVHDTTDAQISETTDAQVPETPDAQIPETTDAQVPDTTDAQIPETTDTQVHETSDAHVPKMTDAQVLETSDAYVPGRTDGQVPKTTDPQVPETINPQVPEMTDAQGPKTTDVQAPKTTDPQVPKMTDAQVPKTTDVQVPETTDPQVPKMTDAHDLEMTDSQVSETTEPRLHITVGLPACSFQSQQALTTPEDLRSLLDRVYGEITSGHLPQVSQHPSLQCPEFLLSFERYCNIHSHSVQQLVSVKDPVHSLPLVYWSVFSRSHTLTQWCLTHMTKTQSGLKLLSPPVLLACAVFDQLAGNSSCRLQSLLKDTLTPKHFSHKTDTVELPLLADNQRLTGDGQQYLQLIIGSESPNRDVHYLCDRSMPIPAEVIKVQVSGEKVKVEVGDRRLWYLAQRLIADREVDGRDGEGNTLLHAAISKGNPAIIQLAVQGGASLSERNRQGQTAYSVAQKQRGWWRKGGSSDVSEYFTAIHSGDMVKVKTLLCLGVSVEDRDRDGHTGRYAACKAGQGDIADLLTQLGAEASTEAGTGPVSLHDAANKGNTDKVMLLLCRGADINVQDEDGRTALHVAVLEGHTETAELLIGHNAAVNVQDKYGRTPLHDTVFWGRTNKAELLILHNAAVNVQDKVGRTPLHDTVFWGQTDTAELLIRHNAAVNVQNKDGRTPLHDTVTWGHTDTAELLIRHNAAVNVQNKDGRTPLHDTVTWGHTDTAELLIRHNAAVNVQDMNGRTPLHDTVSLFGNTNTAELLIRNNAAVNVQDKDGKTPLHDTVFWGHTDTADLLIRHNAAVNVQNKDGRTPLHDTVFWGHTDTADLLIRHNAAVNVQNKDGRTPLHCTVRNGFTDTAELLIRHNAAVNVQDKDGRTPLHYTVLKGLTGTADLLIRHNAAVSVQDKDGRTPLHDTVSEGHTDTAELLIRHNARVNVVDKEGHTPLQVAISEGHADTATLLKQYDTG